MTKNNLLRVTQMNAIYLDEEIYKAFHQILQHALRYLSVSKKKAYIIYLLIYFLCFSLG